MKSERELPHTKKKERRERKKQQKTKFKKNENKNERKSELKQITVVSNILLISGLIKVIWEVFANPNTGQEARC